MEQFDIKRLEFGIDELIRLCNHLSEENNRLRDEILQLKKNQTRLVENQKLSRSRMEAIISRLKTMEHEL